MPLFLSSKRTLLINASTKSVGVTILRRETNGTVTVVSLANPWNANLSRQSNGTVTVLG